MIKIVFFATPDIAIKSLDYLNKSEDFEVSAVVCQPDKPTGRGHKIAFPPVKSYAIEHKIEVLQPACIRKDTAVMNRLRELKPDFFVTFAFGQILSQEVLDIPKFDTINLHASLLPKYRGANPIQCAIINGDVETGICTMITEAGLDCGDICLREKIEINCEMNFEQLHDVIADDSPELISKTLKQLYEGKLVSIPQKHEDATVAPKIKKEDTKINWAKSANQIHNLIRGIYKAPCAHFIFNNKIIKVLQSKVAEAPLDTSKQDIGAVVAIDKKGIKVSCGNGFLNIIKVRPEGKGEMSARDWANGARIKVGDMFE